jgi:hypothetical protein
MLGVKIQTNAYRGDFTRWSEEFDRGLYSAHKLAAQAFLTRMIEGVAGEFPVYTGMAKSSLKPLARHLDLEEIVQVTPVADPELNEEFGYWQSPETGEEMGEPSPGTRFLDEDHNQYGIYRVRFKWEIAIDHFEENDIYNVPRIKNTPWGMVDAASEVFMDTIAWALPAAIPGIDAMFGRSATQSAVFSEETQLAIFMDPRNIAVNDELPF